GGLLAGDLAADRAPLLFAGAAPDARVLVGLEGVLEAVTLHRALAAHLLGTLDLDECVARRAGRKEEIRVGVATDGITPPAVLRVGESEARSKDGHVVRSWVCDGVHMLGRSGGRPGFRRRSNRIRRLGV